MRLMMMMRVIAEHNRGGDACVKAKRALAADLDATAELGHAVKPDGLDVEGVVVAHRASGAVVVVPIITTTTISSAAFVWARRSSNSCGCNSCSGGGGGGNGPRVSAVVERVPIGAERIRLRILVVLDTAVIGDAVADEVGGQISVGPGYEVVVMRGCCCCHRLCCYC